jgi:hypothetical protein
VSEQWQYSNPHWPEHEKKLKPSTESKAKSLGRTDGLQFVKAKSVMMMMIMKCHHTATNYQRSSMQ